MTKLIQFPVFLNNPQNKPLWSGSDTAPGIKEYTVWGQKDNGKIKPLFIKTTGRAGGEWLIYPILAKDKLNIQMKNASFAGDYVVEIPGMNGTKHILKIFDAQQIRESIVLPVTGLPAGLYLLHIVYGGKSVSEKFMVE